MKVLRTASANASAHPLQTGLTFDWIRLTAELKKILDPKRVINKPEELLVYECDGLVSYRQRPALVVLPRTTEEVAQVVKLCSRYQVPFVARGSGTGLSGGGPCRWKIASSLPPP